MKCPVCGGAELIHDTRDIPHIYKGELTTIPKVTGDFCSSCGEVIMSMKEANKFSQLIGEFREQVNATYVQPGYITEVRLKLHLDKKEAAEIFGGGKNAFTRYESGSAKPPLSLIKLFRVLDKHPDLLNEIRAA